MREFSCSKRRSMAVLAALLLLAGCGEEPPKAAAPPATEKPKSESDLARISLLPDVVKSLGIQTAPLQSRSVQETLRLTGWIMAKQGNEVTVTAPLAGYIRAPAGEKGVPVAGQPATADQQLFTLEPVLPPVEQLQMAALKLTIEGDIAKAQANLAAARKELDRVRGLVSQKIKTEQELEQALARHRSAEVDVATAEEKRKLFAATGKDASGPRLHPLPVRSPRSGTVLTVHVSPGQYVAAAAPLVTIADLSEVWVRVPVPEHDLPRIDRAMAASVRGNGGAPVVGQPVSLVPQVDLARHTADMLYALKPDAKQAVFAKDQMVSVDIPLGAKRRETVVPYSAIVFDAYGGAWIYLYVSPPEDNDFDFVRRRVEIGPRFGDDVVIRPAGKAGDRVVVAGAAQIFSREFYAQPRAPGEAKGPIDDDDD